MVFCDGKTPVTFVTTSSWILTVVNLPLTVIICLIFTAFRHFITNRHDSIDFVNKISFLNLIWSQLDLIGFDNRFIAINYQYRNQCLVLLNWLARINQI